MMARFGEHLNANDEWLKIVTTLLHHGQEVSPRGKLVKEIVNYSSIVSMDQPILTISERALGYKFMAAEAAWIISGSNKVQDIKRFSRQISQYSDDGYFFKGAYGPMVVEQLSYICSTLAKDLDTRQAVLSIWRPNPGPSKDIPCTISAQWMIRDNKLHCIDNMRSSDVWVGWPYDIFNFSMLSHYIRLMLFNQYGIPVQMGNIYLTAASQHIYQEHWMPGQDIALQEAFIVEEYPKISEAIPNGSITCETFVDMLWHFANTQGALYGFTKMIKNGELYLDA